MTTTSSPTPALQLSVDRADLARRVAGGGLVASALLSVVGYAILGTQFGWPDVLDEPGHERPRRLRRG